MDALEQSAPQGSDLPQTGTEIGNGQSEAAAKAEAKRLGQEFDDYELELNVYGNKKPIKVAELKKRAQMLEAAEQNFQKAKEFAKNQEKTFKTAEKLLELGKDPRAFLEAMGHNPQKWAEALLTEHIQYEAMSPEQKQLIAERKRREQLEKELEQTKLTERQQQEQALEARLTQVVDEEITRAMKDGKLPKKRYYVARIAAQMHGAIKRKDFEALNPARLASKIRNDFIADSREVYSDATPAELREYLGDAIIEKIVRSEVDRLRANQPSGNTPQGSKPATPKTGKKQKYFERESDYDAWVESLKS